MAEVVFRCQVVGRRSVCWAYKMRIHNGLGHVMRLKTVVQRCCQGVVIYPKLMTPKEQRVSRKRILFF